MSGHHGTIMDGPRGTPPSGGSSGKSTSNDIEFKIARLDLRPGDILVVKCPSPLQDIQRDRIMNCIRDATGHRVMVIDGGLDIAVLTAAEIEARSTI